MYEVERKSFDIEINGNTYKCLERTMLDQRALDATDTKEVDAMLLVLADALKNNYEKLPFWKRSKVKKILSARGLNKNLSARQISAIYLKLISIEGIIFDKCEQCGGPVEKKNPENQSTRE